MSLSSCKKVRCNNLMGADFKTVAQLDAAGELTPTQQRALANIQGLWINGVCEICPEARGVVAGPIQVAEFCTTQTLRGELTEDQMEKLIHLDEKTMALIGEVLFPGTP